MWLVTAPLEESYSLFMKVIGKASEANASIPWNTMNTLDILPDFPTDHIIPQHMAVFVLDTHVYYNSELTLLEKIGKGRFCEHQGPRSSETDGEGAKWADDKILSIIAIEPLGGTGMSDNEILLHSFIS
ncbi:hypothetical protein K469DRAFT_77610 [Zopfia rhizophila CBS 207.26]|uniref:Uncharacterized protein n=1 Tax=Zopfia rhizophila CBS 207.26 TaxID=1314779 RepID=A0A6A6DA87_9PEZI|nr:hypothetical protein K469DRAFT_77610 [Zopfia rhizophila CBS 207.26]